MFSQFPSISQIPPAGLYPFGLQQWFQGEGEPTVELGRLADPRSELANQFRRSLDEQRALREYLEKTEAEPTPLVPEIIQDIEDPPAGIEDFLSDLSFRESISADEIEELHRSIRSLNAVFERQRDEPANEKSEIQILADQAEAHRLMKADNKAKLQSLVDRVVDRSVERSAKTQAQKDRAAAKRRTRADNATKIAQQWAKYFPRTKG